VLWIYLRGLQGQNEHLPRAISCRGPPDCSAFLKLWEVTRLENPGFWSVCILMDKLVVQGIHNSNDFAKREILSGWSPALGKTLPRMKG